MASQLLAGLAGLGYAIEAIAPITDEELGSGDRFAAGNRALRVARFTMPYPRPSPDVPPADEYDQRERREIERLISDSMTRHRPDVIVIGHESFAPHVVHLARAHHVPSVLLFQGGTTMGILNGSYPAPLAERLLGHARKADVAVTSADHMRRALGRIGVADVRVIPNPVDLERFRPTRRSACVRSALALGDDALVVAHVSNLKSIKRPLDFLAAAEIAAPKDERLVFVVVGDGAHRAELEQACAARGLAHRFRFPGWIDHERIPQFLNCADIVVMPSAGEAQALVYLESLACRRTLIASDIPAAREVIENDRTGIFYRTGDIPEMATQILRAAGDPDLRARLGRGARKAVANHSLSRIVSLYAALLDDLIAEDAGAVTAGWL